MIILKKERMYCNLTCTSWQEAKWKKASFYDKVKDIKLSNFGERNVSGRNDREDDITDGNFNFLPAYP